MYFVKKFQKKIILILDFDWINVNQSLSLHNDLNGLIVVVDFFTYCCINCLHILPKLHHIEQRFNESVLVIGIHSPKFPNEKDIANVADAVIKYDITHPIANDPDAFVWNELDIQCWPTVLIIGPNAQLLMTLVGETGINDYLELYCSTAIEYFNKRNQIDSNRAKHLPIKLLKNNKSSNVLCFPGKLTVSPDGSLIAISDSKHNRVLIVTLAGIILHIIGSGKAGFEDGSLNEAQFNNPQGLSWKNNKILYLADTDNHAIRELNIDEKQVKTLVGNGQQGFDKIGGNIGVDQCLSSPWDVSFADEILYIANTGVHQIWALILSDEVMVMGKSYIQGSCFAFSGNGEEANRNNSYPKNASFAQPSGICYDKLNKVIYVADSESSSIRSINAVTGSVQGIVGGDINPLHLFAFGDVDGKGTKAKLQHPLGIAVGSDSQILFVADTYNHKASDDFK